MVPVCYWMLRSGSRATEGDSPPAHAVYFMLRENTNEGSVYG
jgi:hypothetical protein